MRIVLTQDQLADVDSVAERVHVRYQSVVRSRFSPKDIQELRREGFRAELALSLVLGLAWNRGDPQLADVGTMDGASRRRGPGAGSPPRISSGPSRSAPSCRTGSARPATSLTRRSRRARGAGARRERLR